MRVKASSLVKREDVVKALHKLKCGKAGGVYGNTVEILKKVSVVDCLVKILNACINHNDVPKYW